MAISSKVKKVDRNRSVESSVTAAKETAIENEINNVEFINGKVEKVLPELLKKEKAEAIIFDPPRRGIDEKSLRSVVKNKIKKNSIYFM